MGGDTPGESLRDDYTRFVILSAARTGSNLLASALNTGEHIVCFRELFNGRSGFIDYHVEGYDNRSAEDLALRNRDFARFLEERIFVPWPERVRAVGFKMPYEHFLWFPDMLTWLQERPRVHVLHLRRRNMLRALVSLRVAQKTGGWVEDVPFTLAQALTLRYAMKAARHPLEAMTAIKRLLWPAKAGKAEPAWKSEREPVSFTADECRFYFDWSERTGAEYDEALKANPVLALSYEELVGDRRRALGEVQRFLDVPREGLFLTTRQQNPEPLRELLANYDELRAEFQGTRYADFFDSP